MDQARSEIQIQDFSRGRGGGWYIGFAESMGLVHKTNRKILAILRDRNYVEVSVQSACFYFCHDNYNRFPFNFFFLQKGVASHVIPPPSTEIHRCARTVSEGTYQACPQGKR